MENCPFEFHIVPMGKAEGKSSSKLKKGLYWLRTAISHDHTVETLSIPRASNDGVGRYTQLDMKVKEREERLDAGG